MKFIMLADYWDSKLSVAIGKDGGKLKQAYTITKTTLQEARRRNYRVIEQKTATGIRLILSS